MLAYGGKWKKAVSHFTKAMDTMSFPRAAVASQWLCDPATPWETQLQLYSALKKRNLLTPGLDVDGKNWEHENTDAAVQDNPFANEEVRKDLRRAAPMSSEVLHGKKRPFISTMERIAECASGHHLGTGKSSLYVHREYAGGLSGAGAWAPALALLRDGARAGDVDLATFVNGGASPVDARVAVALLRCHVGSAGNHGDKALQLIAASAERGSISDSVTSRTHTAALTLWETRTRTCVTPVLTPLASTPLVARNSAAPPEMQSFSSFHDPQKEEQDEWKRSASLFLKHLPEYINKLTDVDSRQRSASVGCGGLAPSFSEVCHEWADVLRTVALVTDPSTDLVPLSAAMREQIGDIVRRGTLQLIESYTELLIAFRQGREDLNQDSTQVDHHAVTSERAKREVLQNAITELRSKHHELLQGGAWIFCALERAFEILCKQIGDLSSRGNNEAAGVLLQAANELGAEADSIQTLDVSRELSAAVGKKERPWSTTGSAVLSSRLMKSRERLFGSSDEASFAAQRRAVHKFQLQVKQVKDTPAMPPRRMMKAHAPHALSVRIRLLTSRQSMEDKALMAEVEVAVCCDSPEDEEPPRMGWNPEWLPPTLAMVEGTQARRLGVRVGDVSSEVKLSQDLRRIVQL